MEQNNLALEKLEKELIKINSTKTGRRAFMTALPILMASSCASMKKPTTSDRYREGDNTGQQAALTVEEEKKMTKGYLPKMKKEYPAVKNQKVQRYISSIGNELVRTNSLHRNPYEYNFTVVETKQINAFALPAGEIYVTKPLLKMAKTEAELVGVLGHEIGHVQARHSAERIV